MNPRLNWPRISKYWKSCFFTLLGACSPNSYDTVLSIWSVLSILSFDISIFSRRFSTFFTENRLYVCFAYLKFWKTWLMSVFIFDLILASSSESWGGRGAEDSSFIFFMTSCSIMFIPDRSWNCLLSDCSFSIDFRFGNFWSWLRWDFYICGLCLGS